MYLQEIFSARTDRLEYLEEKRSYMLEDINDLTEQLASLLSGEGDEERGGGAEEASLKEQWLQLQEELERVSSKLEAVRIQEWVRNIGPSSARDTHGTLFRRMFEESHSAGHLI